MELTNAFEVAVPVEEAWGVLTDVERIAPCLPGAELQEVEGDEYRGVVKVKVGPITASYRGSARFEELDETVHRAVLKAEGRETRGQGNASATITATLSPAGDGTKVEVVTDLAITGKVAQFGRGVLADVSGKLLDQFVQNLETMVLAPAAPPAPPAEPAPATAETGGDARSDSTMEAEPGPESGAAAGPAGAASPAGGPDAAASASNNSGKGRSPKAPSATAPSRKAAAAKPPAEDVATEAEEVPAPAIRQIQSAPVEPVDLGRIAGPSLAKRLIPFASIAGALFLIRVIVYALRRRKQ
jgi:carbon monoxide dehydrogenase subunit G